MADRSPTGWLLSGLAISVAAVAVYAAFTVAQIRNLRALQADAIDRNRADTLLLLRIQNDLNAIAMTMRDMLDGNEPYPLTAWRGQLKRIRGDLEDALEREAKLAPADRSKDQQSYLKISFAGFWDAVDRMFLIADSGNESEARTQIRLSLQARQAALSTAVSRLLIQNNEEEQRVAARAQQIYDRVEHNVYGFLAGMIVVILVTGLSIVRFNRRMFQQLAALSERRSELAQQLIATQENTYRYISRELHDEFGQILTAMGAMMQRLERRAAPEDGIRAELHELREITQSALEKVRTLSQALHPVILEESGLDSALEWYLPTFQSQTGIAVQYHRSGGPAELDPQTATHLYRVLQEALNNVTRHSRSPDARVRLDISGDRALLEVEDHGIGFDASEPSRGMGLAGMRERAELMGGAIEFMKGSRGGTLVRLTVPITRAVEAHAS